MNCKSCGKTLEGKQTKYCSQNCGCKAWQKTKKGIISCRKRQKKLLECYVYKQTESRKYDYMKGYVDSFIKKFGKRIRKEEIEDTADFYSKYVCDFKKKEQCKLKELILIDYDKTYNQCCLTPAKPKEASEILEAQVARHNPSTMSSEEPIM